MTRTHSTGIPRPTAALFASLLLLLATDVRADELAGDELIEVPVLVNVVEGAEISTEKIEDAIDGLNEIFRENDLDVQLVLPEDGISTGVSDQPDAPPATVNGNEGDGAVTSGERDKLTNAGEQQLDTEVGEGKGVLLVFVNDIDEPFSDPIGVATPGRRVIFVETGLTTLSTGVVMAHEFCHAFGLGDFHDVFEEGDGLADDSAHYDGDMPGGGQNLMGGGSLGTVLGPAQVSEVEDNARKAGDVVKQSVLDQIGEFFKKLFSTAHAADGALGEGGDEFAGIFSYEDIRTANIFWSPDDQLSSGYIQLQDVLPDPNASGGVFLNNFFFVVVDADSNPATGFHKVMDGQDLGVEYSIELHLLSAPPFLPFTFSGFLFDFATGVKHPLASLEIETQLELAGGAEGFVPTPSFDELRFEFASGLFTDTGVDMTVGLRSSFGGSLTLDELVMVTSQPDAGPLLQLDAYSASPGAVVRAVGQGFTPGATVVIEVDDDPVASGTADAAGAVAIPFAAPAPDGTPMWVRAVGPGAERDFQLLHPAGNFTVSGSGCSDLGAVPAIHGLGLAELGTSGFTCQLTGAPAGLPATLLAGTSTTSFQGLPLPLDLGLFGYPGCFLRQNAVFQFPTVTQGAAGGAPSAAVAIAVPDKPGLAGVVVPMQWLVFDPLAPGFPIALTALGEMTIQ